MYVIACTWFSVPVLKQQEYVLASRFVAADDRQGAPRSKAEESTCWFRLLGVWVTLLSPPPNLRYFGLFCSVVLSTWLAILPQPIVAAASKSPCASSKHHWLFVKSLVVCVRCPFLPYCCLPDSEEAMAKTRVGVLLRESVGGNKSTNKSQDLASLTSKYHEFCKKIRSLIESLKAHHDTMRKIEQTRSSVSLLMSYLLCVPLNLSRK